MHNTLTNCPVHGVCNGLLLFSLIVQLAVGSPGISTILDKDCYKQLAPIAGGPRQEHGVAGWNDKVYVIGGMKRGTNVTIDDASAEVYNIDTNTWSSIPDLPIQVHHPNVAAVDGKIYVLGALTGINPRRTVAQTYRFDPSKPDSWELLGEMPPGTERGASAVAVHGSVVYIGGGLRPTENTATGHFAVDMVSSYDTDSGKWTALPRLPEARDHVGGAFVKDTFYVVGGRVGNQTSVRGTVFMLEKDGTNWETSKSRMPTPRGGISASAVGNRIYTFGGEGNVVSSKGVFSECESYDVEEDEWRRETTMKIPRHGMGAVALDGTIYIPGGGLTNGFKEAITTVEAFDPDACGLEDL
jgi:N-acetylneuraminic acid mutarotase